MNHDAARPSRIGEQDAARFTFSLDGESVEACPGETIAGALLAAGRRSLRRTAKRDEPRGLYCVMGVCWECVVLVDGQTVRACIAPASPGLAVQSLRGHTPA
jgi:aerobic-type carbon monoxide dehydrogenase small subunit (CoxS/CutS family)